MSLTAIQHRYLTVIREFISSKGYCPSFYEIGVRVGGRSVATVHRMVHILERKGYLRMDARKNNGSIGYRSIIAALPKHANKFNSCQSGHECIFFRSDKCPLCIALEGVITAAHFIQDGR